MKPPCVVLPATTNSTRKLHKPQVERHRRERMNKSLETLRTLLLQGQQNQDLSCRRVEKAEILEHTVQFLKNRVCEKIDKDRERQQFQDGFSDCLQRAARFLRVEGEQLRVDGALASALSHQHPSQSPRPTTTPVPDQTQPKKPSVQSPEQNQWCRHHLCVAVSDVLTPLHRREPLVQEARQALASHQSPSLTHSLPVWRPWP